MKATALYSFYQPYALINRNHTGKVTGTVRDTNTKPGRPLRNLSPNINSGKSLLEKELKHHTCCSMCAAYALVNLNSTHALSGIQLSSIFPINAQAMIINLGFYLYRIQGQKECMPNFRHASIEKFIQKPKYYAD